MAFAPGKVILLGEHAVVYGHPAVAGALAQGVTVSVVAGEPGLSVPAWNVLVTVGDATPLGQAFSAIVEALDVRPDVRLSADFGVPTSSGLGSSAALAVAVARALMPEASDERVLAAAMRSETVFHGRPSGIDAAVAAHGGFGRYTREAGFSSLRAARPVPLVVGHTGKQRDTRGRVARVGELLSERPDETRERFAAIASLVERGVRAIEAGSLGELGACMDENARHLEALEVSSPEIERLCALAREAGAVGAKLTGGGGGGCVLALAPGREEAVRDAWSRAGYTSFATEVGHA